MKIKQTPEMVMEQLQELDTHKTDQTAQISSMAFIDHTHIGIDNVGYTFEKPVVKQLLQRMNSASGKHNAYNFGEAMMLQFPDLLVHNMNYLLDDYRNHNYSGEVLVRLYDDKVRSMLSSGYGIVNNSQVLSYTLEHVKTITNNSLRVTSDSWYNENQMVFKSLIEEKDDGGLGVGFVLMNDEIGGGALKISGLIKRFSCDNSIIVSGKTKVNHTSGIYDKLSYIMENVAVQIAEAIKTRDRFNFLEQTVIQPDKFVQLMENFVKVEKLKKELFINMYEGSENKQTHQGFVNGITHMVKELNPEKRVELEEKAGNIVWMNIDQLFREYAVK